MLLVREINESGPWSFSYGDVFVIDTKGQEPSLANRKILLLESSSDVPAAIAADEPFSNRVCAVSVGSARFLKRAWVASAYNALSMLFQAWLIWGLRGQSGRVERGSCLFTLASFTHCYTVCWDLCSCFVRLNGILAVLVMGCASTMAGWALVYLCQENPLELFVLLAVSNEAL